MGGWLTILADRARPARWPWTVRAFMVVVVAAILIGWAITTSKTLWGQIMAFSAFYFLLALSFPLSRNDWVRFVITAFHVLISGTIAYGLVFILPEQTPKGPFELRVLLIFATSVITTMLLWHPATGRWVMARQ